MRISCVAESVELRSALPMISFPTAGEKMNITLMCVVPLMVPTLTPTVHMRNFVRSSVWECTDRKILYNFYNYFSILFIRACVSKHYAYVNFSFLPPTTGPAIRCLLWRSPTEGTPQSNEFIYNRPVILTEGPRWPQPQEFTRCACVIVSMLSYSLCPCAPDNSMVCVGAE